MTQTARGLAPAAGSWVSVGLIFLYGVLTSASLSKVIPLSGDFAAHMGATPAQFALLIALMTVLPAALASVAGSIIDRIGAHRALQVVAVVGVAVNAAYLLCTTLQAFMVVRVLEGLIAVGAYSAAPGLIMATVSEARRRRAMAVWSTYTPVGISLGLAMSSFFAGEANWRGGYWIHMALFAVLVATMWMLPRAPAVPRGRLEFGKLFAAWSQVGPLRLSVCFSLLIVVGFGMSTVYPEWYSFQHEVTVGRASSILAMVNLIMIPSGFAAGMLLGRGWRDSSLLTVLVLATIALSVPLYMAGLPVGARLATMMVWMVAQGALIAVVTAALPRVVADPRQGAAAAGLLSQIAALVTLVTPFIWQPLSQAAHANPGAWTGFVVVTSVAVAAAWLAFPRR